MALGLEFHAEDPEFSLATFQNSLLWCFRGEVTLPRVQAALPIHENLRKKFPKGFAVVTIIGDNVPLSMSPEARDLSAKITKDFMPNYCGVCEVVLGSGFRAAAVRSITAGIRLLARSTCPAKVFGDATACSNWLGPLMSPQSASDTFVKVLGQSVDRVGRGFE